MIVATQLGAAPTVTKGRREPTWNAEEVSILRKLYHTVSVEEIAETIGRPKAAVYSKARDLGLSGRDNYQPVQEDVAVFPNRFYKRCHCGALARLIEGECLACRMRGRS